MDHGIAFFFNETILQNCLLPSIDNGTYDNVEVKTRGFGKNPDNKCSIELLDKGRVKVMLNEAAWAPVYGQLTVLYKDDILLGGGYVSGFSNS